LPPAAQAYIRELETRNRQLGERVACVFHAKRTAIPLQSES
jgi:hypothetical protein